MTNLEERYVKKLIVVVLVAFALLAAGEYYLYRQQLHINKMVSEGLIQLKESKTKKGLLNYWVV